MIAAEGGGGHIWVCPAIFRWESVEFFTGVGPSLRRCQEHFRKRSPQTPGICEEGSLGGTPNLPDPPPGLCMCMCLPLPSGSNEPTSVLRLAKHRASIAFQSCPCQGCHVHLVRTVGRGFLSLRCLCSSSEIHAAHTHINARATVLHEWRSTVGRGGVGWQGSRWFSNMRSSSLFSA